MVFLIILVSILVLSFYVYEYSGIKENSKKYFDENKGKEFGVLKYFDYLYFGSRK